WLQRHGHAWLEGVPAFEVTANRERVFGEQGRIRERNGDPRLPRPTQGQRDPDSRQREAAAVDQPAQAHAKRAQERRQVDVGDSHQGLSVYLTRRVTWPTFT